MKSRARDLFDLGVKVTAAVVHRPLAGSEARALETTLAVEREREHREAIIADELYSEGRIHRPPLPNFHD